MPDVSESDQAHENACELIGLVDHDVVPAIDDPGFPRIVTSNPFECRGEPRKVFCADIRLPGDSLVSTREPDLLGEAGGRSAARRVLAARRRQARDCDLRRDERRRAGRAL